MTPSGSGGAPARSGGAAVPTSFRRRYLGTALAWSAIGLVLVVAQHVSNRVTRGGYRFGAWTGLAPYFDGWAQFDGFEYLNIAADGYWYRPGQRAPIVFFPLFALIIRAVETVVDEPIVAGVLVSAVAGLVGTLLYRRWLDVVGVTAIARPWALAVLLVYPYGWYRYGPIYSDALFAALVVGAFLLVESDRLPTAALVGALATATRPTGLALVPALLVLAAERRGVLTFVPRPRWPAWLRSQGLPSGIDRARWSRRCWWPVAALAGVGAYSAYLGVRFGDPFIWATSQAEYSGSGPKTWFKAGFVARWLEWDDPVYTLTITAQALILLGVLLTAPAVGRRFGWGYATFVVCLGLIPSFSSRDFLGVGRYLMAAFPTAALVGEWMVDRRVTRVVWLGLAGLALLVMNMAFSRSRMLA